MKRFLDNIICTLLVFATILLFPLLSLFQISDALEKAFTDFLITDISYSKIRGTETTTADTNIVLVDISSLTNNGIIALIQKIALYEPKVIGIERILEKTANQDLNNAISDELSKVPNLVFAAKYSQYDYDAEKFNIKNSSYKGFVNNSEQGFTNLLIGKEQENFTVREFSPVYSQEGKLDTAFAVKLALKFESSKATNFLNRNNQSEIINFRGNFQKFIFLNSGDLLKNDDEDIDIVRNKIVILGNVYPFSNSYKLSDLYFTPLNERVTGRTFPDMFEVVVQANIISMILNEDFFYVISFEFSIIIAFLACFFNMTVFSLIMTKLEKWYELLSLLIFIAESLLILYLTVYFYHEFNIDLKLNLTLIVFMLSLLVFEGYYQSIKPLTLKTINKLKEKKNEKNMPD